MEYHGDEEDDQERDPGEQKSKAVARMLAEYQQKLWTKSVCADVNSIRFKLRFVQS